MNDNQGDVVVEEIGSELEDQDTGVPLYKIVSYPADLTLEGLHQRWQREEIIIPPFQRGWVWSHTQASRLIESFLLGLPVPSIFMYKEPSTQKQLVIDGQQRLRTIWGTGSCLTMGASISEEYTHSGRGRTTGLSRSTIAYAFEIRFLGRWSQRSTPTVGGEGLQGSRGARSHTPSRFGS